MPILPCLGLPFAELRYLPRQGLLFFVLLDCMDEHYWPKQVSNGKADQSCEKMLLAILCRLRALFNKSIKAKDSSHYQVNAD